MVLIVFTDGASVDRAERTYLVPADRLSDFLRIVYAGFRHPRYDHLISKTFLWEPADHKKDRVTVVFLPQSTEV